ncbi:DUF397 domain-containing protein [Streptomyces sp. wa1064]|uniref:DUF397 domain-containing protein n=1 Tax=Streptomyces sp. wa1064 TaxID=1828213 RepID=UPI003821440E
MTSEPSSHQEKLASASWRKSRFSGDQGACSEAALLQDGRIAVRNSNHAGAGTIFLNRTEMEAWLKGVKAGEFDDLGSQDSATPMPVGLSPIPAA